MNVSKNWYAVYTRPKLEKKVSLLLNRAGIENYCPLNRMTKQWNNPKKIILEPLFSSCVFVRVSEADHKLLKKIDGIINMVYWLGKPAVIHNNEIQGIKNMLTECTNIKLEKRPIYFNDAISIFAQKYAEMEGQATSLNIRTLIVTLPSLGYTMKAEVEAGNVRVIEPGIFSQYEAHN